jgi:urease accessory protein
MRIHMSARLFRPASLAALTFFLATAPAAAHHVMGGKTPSTFMEGLLSGFAHPVIGADHLAFLLAIGVAVGVSGLSLALPAVFVAAMAVGVAVHVKAIGLPGAEIVVALSVLLAGGLIAWGRTLPVGLWAALFAVAGLFHGYALGESIAGAESTPIWAYLLGLVVIQSALTVGVALVARRVAAGVTDLAPRLAGAAVVIVGLAALVQQLAGGA